MKKKQKVEKSDVLEWLLSDEVNKESFFYCYFEKKPLHISRQKPDYYDSAGTSLFDYSKLKDILLKAPLTYGDDLNVCKCVQQQKKSFNKKGEVKYKDLDLLFHKQRCTVQLFQPQKYDDDLFDIIRRFEELFNTLVGANVYLTPADSQGLAPHYDAVEVFILQTEGSKHWKLYDFLNDNETLPTHSSGDLNELEIGKPILECTLHQGDFLYIPRGIIHQAKASADGNSTHVTISTFAHHNFASFLSGSLPSLMEAVTPYQLDLRKGLPLDFNQANGYIQSLVNVRNGAEANSSLTKTVANLLRKVADQIEQDELGMYNEILNEQVEEFSLDYMKHRLPYSITPPHTLTSSSSSSAARVTMNDKVRLVSKSHVRVLPMTSEEDGEDYLLLVHSLFNDRKLHMSHIESSENSEQEEMKNEISIDLCFEPCIVALFQEYPNWKSLKQLKLNQNQAQFLDMIQMLVDNQLVFVQNLTFNKC